MGEGVAGLDGLLAMPLDSYRFLSGYYFEGDGSRLQLLARVFSDQVFG